MIKINYKTQKQGFIYSLIILSSIFGCNNNNTEENTHKNFISTFSETRKIVEIAVERPPFNDDFIFPCSECHNDLKTNPVPRKLDMHEEIGENFNHDSENRWCLDCHNSDTRDSLRLASGKLLGFNESYKLCGQCHGDKLRDWKVGVHGKRTGNWNGDKQYLLCVHCHDPHSPKFKNLTPEPPPVTYGEVNVKH